MLFIHWPAFPGSRIGKRFMHLGMVSDATISPFLRSFVRLSINKLVGLRRDTI